MSTRDRSGWTSARFATTTGFTTSTEITNLLTGTNYDGDHDIEADGQGRDASAGFSVRGVIRSSAITAAWVSTFDGYHDLGTEIFIKLISKSGLAHKIGPVVIMAAPEGPGSGAFNAIRVNFHGTGEQRSDLLSIAAA